MCEVASFKHFENSLTTVKVMTKNKVAPFYLGHGVHTYRYTDRQTDRHTDRERERETYKLQAGSVYIMLW